MRHHVDHDQSGEYFITPASRGLPVPAWLFEPAELSRQGLLRGDGRGRRRALFLEHEGEALVLRHYWRGGVPARLSADLYPWLGLARSRPARELDLLETLRARSLPVPAVAGARVLRTGGVCYRGDILMRRVVDAGPFDEYIASGCSDAQLWCRVGATIARFHAHGAWHADLNARNLLVDASAGVWLIDWDRGRLRPPGRWQATSLARLRRSLAKTPELDAAARRHWGELLEGYSNPRNAPPVAPAESTAAGSVDADRSRSR